MSLLASQSWASALAAEPPAKTALAAVTLVAAMIGAAVALRAVNHRIGSLRAQVLAITLGALAVGATLAALLA